MTFYIQSEKHPFLPFVSGLGTNIKSHHSKENNVSHQYQKHNQSGVKRNSLSFCWLMGASSGGLCNMVYCSTEVVIMLVVIFLNKGRIHVVKRQNNNTVRIGVRIFNNTYFHDPEGNQLRKWKEEDGESFLHKPSFRAWR